ncbi:MAG: hypothetical protein GQ534_12430 [Candidatus Delongbacteria bacterium]|nr:hypothetical protein [Candidatus Delongbacteria bacterium]
MRKIVQILLFIISYVPLYVILLLQNLNDNAFDWMIKESEKSGLSVEAHLVQSLKTNTLATLHNSRKGFFRIKGKDYRPIKHKEGKVLIHESVKVRWEKDSKYRPKNLKKYVEKYGWEGVE